MSSQTGPRGVISFLFWSIAVVGWAQIPPQPTPVPGLPKAQSVPRVVENAANGPNFGFAAVPPNSVSVTLSWQTVPGATGMVVYRDGNVIATLPPTNLSFVDRNVKPFGHYTYHLSANGLTQVINGRSTAFPVVSPSITVDVPPPVVPSGFSAQLIGGSVKLTWNPVPEASRYEVDLGGRTVTVTGTPPTFTDSAPNNRDAIYAVRTVVQAYDGSVTPGYWSNKLTIRVRPFVMIVAGDSIMWGQGLKTANKFTSQFTNYLASKLGGPTRILVIDHSHSGAILGQEADVDNATGPTDVTNAVFGEVPESFPSIPRQALVLARRDLQQRRLQLEDVDLVLMDGCINDVTVGSLLDPTTSNDQIGAQAVDYCNRRMTTTLSQIHSTYKNAKVLVTGYYTLASPESNPLVVSSWTAALGLIPVPGGEIVSATLTGAAVPAVFTAAVIHSKTFIDASNSMLQSAVLNANSLAGTPYATFISPSFQNANAFAAPQSMLWLLELPPTPPNLFDEVFTDRTTICRRVPNPPNNCVVAATGHPNAAGALTYANRLIPPVSGYLPGWLAQFSVTVQLPGR